MTLHWTSWWCFEWTVTLWFSCGRTTLMKSSRSSHLTWPSSVQATQILDPSPRPRRKAPRAEAFELTGWIMFFREHRAAALGLYWTVFGALPRHLCAHTSRITATRWVYAIVHRWWSQLPLVNSGAIEISSDRLIYMSFRPQSCVTFRVSELSVRRFFRYKSVTVEAVLVSISLAAVCCCCRIGDENLILFQWNSVYRH